VRRKVPALLAGAICTVAQQELLLRWQSSCGVELSGNPADPLCLSLCAGLDDAMQCSSAQPLPLPALPYEYDALHPFYSDAALKLHRQWHSQRARSAVQ
jgi:hypothetical protein